MAELQQAAMAQALAALNGHDAKKFSEVYAENATVSVAGLNELWGRDAVEQNMKEWFETFSNIKLGFRRVWVRGSNLIIEWVINGKHTGELIGVKGQDNPIGHYGLSIVWFDEEGKVKRENRYGELGTVLTQVGAAKAKPREIPPVPEKPEMIVSKGGPEEQKALESAQALHGALQRKSEAAFLGALADDIQYEGVLFLETVKGKAEAKKFFGGVTRAFPDLKLTNANSWGIGSYAIVEYSMSGTHKAALGALPASKKKIDVHLVDVYEMKDGKAVRAWTYQNSVELMTQVGAFEAPVAAPPKAPGDAPKTTGGK